ncbi:MAG TPA: DUF4123 domain-containing protein, partial [Isosphaeraceae bacterium]
PGDLAQVGRSTWADLSNPVDPALSGVHFLLECGADACRIRDVSGSRATFVNGVRVDTAPLHDGDRIAAGHTTFSVRFGTDEPAPPGAPAAATASEGTGASSHPIDSPAGAEPVAGMPDEDRLLLLLRSEPQPLYALLDAARAPDVLLALRGSGEEYQSLYEGPRGDELADFAPYLVALPTGSPLCATLVRAGWGRGRGVFLTCPEPFAVVRKHFRHFLLVQSEDGRTLYFRFYDPRVLRLFLPTCNPPETAAFFGPIGAFLMEADDPRRLLRFTPGAFGVERTMTAAVIEADAAATR